MAGAMGTAPKRGAEEEVALGLARGLEEGRSGRIFALDLAVLAVNHDLDDGEENPADVRLGGPEEEEEEVCAWEGAVWERERTRRADGVRGREREVKEERRRGRRGGGK